MKQLDIQVKFKPKVNVFGDQVSSSIRHFFRRFKEGEYILDFNIKLSNGVNLQRGYVWDLDQKRSLILSILKGITIPPIVFIVGGEKDKIYRVLDGKQRLSTIQSFLNNGFPINVDGDDYYFKDFTADSQNYFLNSYLQEFRIWEPMEEGKIIPFSDVDLVDMFEFVNFQGTPQDYSHLKNLRKSL